MKKILKTLIALIIATAIISACESAEIEYESTPVSAECVKREHETHRRSTGKTIITRHEYNTYFITEDGGECFFDDKVLYNCIVEGDEITVFKIEKFEDGKKVEGRYSLVDLGDEV